VIKRCDKEFDHILVHTGQNYDYGLSQIFFDELGLKKPDFYLSCVGKNLGETMGNIISKSFDLIQEVKPDAVLVLGDTNSSLSAISAKRLKCPIFHMEAGNRCWDWNVPEMTNRVMIDHISDVNMPYSHFAYLNLMREGFCKDRTFITGSPMREVIQDNMKGIERSDILQKLGLTSRKYLVFSVHREENIGVEKNFQILFSSLNRLADSVNMPVVFSLHPRTEKQFLLRHPSFSKNIIFEKPFGFFDYCCLEKNAHCVLSDSGTLTEESDILGFPAVLIRTSTERQEGVVVGSISVGGIEFSSIVAAYDDQVLRFGDHIIKNLVPDYLASNVSEQIVKVIKKETSLINKETWLKD